MKKIITLTITIIALLIFTGCTNNGEANNGNQATDTPSSVTAPSQTQPPTPDPAPQPTPEPPREWTLEEMVETIVAVGEFWNRWWASHHTFEWEHIDDSRSNWQPWDEAITPAHHPLSRGFAIILPSSGFSSLDDIGVYLSQFYTQGWIDAGRFAELVVTMEFMPSEDVHLFGYYGLEEYDGELYVFIQVEWTARSDWRTATHTLVEQDGNRAVVETVVSTYIRSYSPNYDMPTIVYNFTFIDGKIDSGYGEIIFAPSDSTYEPTPVRGHVATIGDMFIFAHLEEHVLIENPDSLHTIEHFNFTGQGDTIFVEASEAMYDVTLIRFTNDWDDRANEITFILTDYIAVAEVIWPDKGLLIHGYMGLGTLPWSGISFYTTAREPRERHFFAIDHDQSDSHNWFMIWEITDQMRDE